MGWLSDINSFHKWEDKDIFKRMKDNPEQLLLGFGDPIGARVAKGITGKDYQSFSDLGIGNRDFKNYQAETGKDPKSVEKVRTETASIFAIAYGAYGADSLGWGSLAGKGMGLAGSTAIKGVSGDFSSGSTATTAAPAATSGTSAPSTGSGGMSFFGSLFGGGGGGGSPFGGPIGGLLGNLFTGGGTSNAATEASMNDPFASQRGQYQSELSLLMSNPDAVKNMPGYQSEYDQALTGVQRQMAAAGNTNSSLAMNTVAQFGPQFEQQFLDKELDRLMVLSGATIQPQHPGDTYQKGIGGSQDALSSLFGKLGGSLFGNSSLFSGLFGGSGGTNMFAGMDSNSGGWASTMPTDSSPWIGNDLGSFSGIGEG